MSDLEEKIRNLEKTISQKDMPKEDKERLLVEVGRIEEDFKRKKQALKDHVRQVKKQKNEAEQKLFAYILDKD
jgi:hypothetical protein